MGFLDALFQRKPKPVAETNKPTEDTTDVATLRISFKDRSVSTWTFRDDIDSLRAVVTWFCERINSQYFAIQHDGGYTVLIRNQITGFTVDGADFFDIGDPPGAD